MHYPENRIELAPGLAGRGRRFVNRTRAERKMRLDIASDRCLVTACRLLADPDNLRDTVSVSMVARRALRLYSDHLDRARATDPALWNEKQAVRQMSQLPGRRRKTATASATSTATASSA